MNNALHDWLAAIGLERYIDAFSANDIDHSLLTTLGDNDLREIGVTSIGHRKRIISAIAADRAARSIKVSTLVPDHIVVPKTRVFLSYGHDQACTGLVERIRTDLCNKGFEVWIDRDRINFGDDWRREITEGIALSSHMIAFLSKHSTRSPGVCREEVAIALGPLQGHVYTVLVEPLSEVTPPLIISHLQWLDMHEWRSLQSSGSSYFDSWYAEKFAAIIDVLSRNSSFAGEVDALRKWLRPLDPAIELAKVGLENFSGRGWLLDGVGEGYGSGEIERWRINPVGGKIFWLSAEPGWGKSCVAVRLAHVARTRILAVHFCRKGQANTLDARQVIRTLAFQMATQLSEFRKLLIARLSTDAVIEGLGPEELFQVLLRQPLQYVIAGDRTASDRQLIVLDGIDETLDQNSQSALLDLLSSSFQFLPDWVGLVVTSRPEAPIVRRLGQFGIRHMEAKDERNQRDLLQHISRWFIRIGVPESESRRALNKVMEAAAGNFLYLRQLESAVDTGLFPLSAVASEAPLPRGLTSLYDCWFSSKFSDREAYSKKYRPLFEIMTAAEEPVSVEVIEQLLGWNAYDQVELLEPLGSLCPFEFGHVRFFHKSLPDWLNDSKESGRAWHVSAEFGHKRLASYVSAALLSGEGDFQGLPNYLLCYGAFHAARTGQPDLGARFLNGVASSASRTTPGLLRVATDRFLMALAGCDLNSLNLISSVDLVQLISRTDTRQALTVACDLLLSRPHDWRHAFEHSPLDGRGATWVFASRWAHSILLLNDYKGRAEWLGLLQIAINPDHPLYLSAAYAFKYVALKREKWIDPEALAPLCTGWTYSRQPAINLLLQLALRRSEIPGRISLPEFWAPTWEYGQIEVDLLVAAMHWRGLVCDLPISCPVLRLFESIEAEISQLANTPDMSVEAREAIDFYWEAGSDLEHCNMLLRVLDRSPLSEAILDLYLGSPIFEASEIAAALVAARGLGRSDFRRELLSRAVPESRKAWGLFIASARLTVAEGEAEEFTVLIKRFSDAADAQLRGLAAMNLASYLREIGQHGRLVWITAQGETIRKFLHDTDIWPVQEVFHLLQEFQDELLATGFDWRVTFEVSSAPIIKTVGSWQEPDCGWSKFEAEASMAKKSQTLHL